MTGRFSLSALSITSSTNYIEILTLPCGDDESESESVQESERERECVCERSDEYKKVRVRSDEYKKVRVRSESESQESEW